MTHFVLNGTQNVNSINQRMCTRYPGIGDPLPGFVHGRRDGLVSRVDAGDTDAARSRLEVWQKVLRSYTSHKTRPIATDHNIT